MKLAAEGAQVADRLMTAQDLDRYNQRVLQQIAATQAAMKSVT